MPDVKIHGYLVKYALTAGIREVWDAELTECGYVSRDRSPGSWDGFCVKDGSDFVRTYEEAVAVAKVMATRKIKSLEKQIAKLRVLAEQPKWESQPKKE